jgi:glutamine amidotransferase
MARLRDNGLEAVIPRTTQPLLGICIGMQLLYEGSEEGDTPCLGLLPGRVRKLRAAPGVRIPHMGWNRLAVRADGPLAAGLDAEHVYFVHSYAASCDESTMATCTHGDAFAAIVSHGRVSGAQFHPERSGAAGARLLANFLGLPRHECRAGDHRRVRTHPRDRRARWSRGPARPRRLRARNPF